MQLFTRRSEEGQLPGLGWIEGDVRRFVPTDPALKVPHMGWDTVTMGSPSALFEDLPEESRFYFVHSYYVTCDQSETVIGRTFYSHDFVAAFQKGNIYGVQFHPEKSHRYGKKVIQNFIERVQ